MNAPTYETVALVLRYPLSLAGLYIALKAVFMCVHDSRNAQALRQDEDDASCVGKLRLSSSKSNRMSEFSLSREGSLGESRVSDIRIGSVGGQFYYEISEGSLWLTPLEGAQVKIDGRAYKGLTEIADGESFELGGAKLKFVLRKSPVTPLSPAGRVCLNSKRHEKR